MKKKSLTRLFVDCNLEIGANLQLSEAQSHYLVHVMKLDVNSSVLVFDGKNGEFLAFISQVSKKSVTLSIIEKTRAFCSCPDIWLLFAPLKKDQTDFVIQKATELGAALISPVITQFSITEKARTDRFKAQALEACEQCRRLDVPVIEEPIQLNKLLENWDKSRTLFFLDETRQAETAVQVFSLAKKQNIKKAALLVGPEGGFSADELNKLRTLDFAQGVSLGPRILRAETAAAAALACWQAMCGDWNEDYFA